MSDLSGWDPEWDKYLAERGLRRSKSQLSYNDSRPDTMSRWIGRTDSPHADNSFQARTYGAVPTSDGTNGWLATGWKSPPFDNPIAAFVYAELNNWGQ